MSDVFEISYAAEVLHITEQTARRRCRQKLLQGVFKDGKKWLVHKPTFDRWIEQRVQDYRPPITDPTERDFEDLPLGRKLVKISREERLAERAALRDVPLLGLCACEARARRARKA